MTDQTTAVRRSPAAPAKDLTPQPKDRRKRRGRFSCLVGFILGCAGLVAGQLGNLYIHFDVFTQFTLHFAGIALAFLIGYFMPRARVLTALSLIVLMGLAISLVPQKLSEGSRTIRAAAADEIPLKLMSFNTWYSNTSLDEIVATIEAEDAGIVTLLEFGPDKSAILPRLKGRFPYQYDCLSIDYCNLVILSKYPFAEPPEARVNWEGPSVVKAKFGPELNDLTVFGVHTLRFPHQRAQFTQLMALAKLIETVPGPIAVMGDFNATPFSRQTKSFADRTRLARLTYLPSWPARLGLPQLAIDHVFVSSGIGVLADQRILPNSGSDHQPIAIEIAIPRN